MSNNASDYDNDLVFPPASADVRATVVEKCDRLEKQLEIAVEALEFYEKPFSCFHPEYNIAQHHKKASEALAKIRRLKYKYIQSNNNISINPSALLGRTWKRFIKPN